MDFGDRAGGVHVPEHRRAAAAQLRRRRRHVCPGSLRQPPKAFCTCTRSHAHTLGQERAKQALDDILDRLPDQFDLHEVRMGWIEAEEWDWLYGRRADTGNEERFGFELRP
jgi:hypothetical protein